MRKLFQTYAAVLGNSSTNEILKMKYFRLCLVLKQYFYVDYFQFMDTSFPGVFLVTKPIGGRK